MKQYETNPTPNGHRKPLVMHSVSPLLRAQDHSRTQNLTSIPEPEEKDARQSSDISPRPKMDARTTLRIDAFLGEWLSPDYFESITSPPGSKMMVAGAKADLLRRGDPVDGFNLSGSSASKQGHFPGGWRVHGSESEETPDAVEDGALSDLSSLSQQLPKLSRANTFSSGKASCPRTENGLGVKLSERIRRYIPPTPSYAVSPSQPIPQGYVAHARDACVNVDYQWDSLRPPLEWGGGGEYGEEWSSMHRRFRKGLHGMLSWYRNHDPSQKPEDSGNTSPALTKTDTNPMEDADDDTDTVLVLVTHGAGCNALIGALTNQPVLIDVGMASLTMAVRKDIDYTRLDFQDGFSHSPTRRRRPSLDAGDSEEYDIKLVASTDHLRPGSQFVHQLQRERSPTTPTREKSPYRYERHVATHQQHGSSSNSTQDTFNVDSDDSASGSNRKSTRRSFTSTIPSSGGLWTPPKPKAVEDVRELLKAEEPLQLDAPPPASGSDPEAISYSLDTSDSSTTTQSPKEFQSDSPPGRSLAQTGLWGAPPHALANERERGAKRRWTLSQAG